MGIASPGPLSPLSLVSKLLSGGKLSRAEARALALSMLSGDVDDILVAAALAALRVRGETAEEVAGFAEALRETCVRVRGPGKPLLDTAGTGGDGMNTINASTAAAIVASAVGAYVAKHGNRGVSSRSGSADVMEALGYPVGHGPLEAECLLSRTRFAFLFAPAHHPAVKRVMPVRRRLGVRTIFNLVGPLSNPAGASRQLLGAPSEGLARLMAEAASMLGYERVLVVTGEPGIDEVSVSGETRVIEVRGGRLEAYTIAPEDMGLGRRPIGELRVGGPEESAARIVKALRGEGRRGDTEFIAANAGAALYVYGAVGDLRDGVEAALQAMEEGHAYRHLQAVLEAARACSLRGQR
jgi:anthranilate phosphoribosyltransferase